PVRRDRRDRRRHAARRALPQGYHRDRDRGDALGHRHGAPDSCRASPAREVSSGLIGFHQGASMQRQTIFKSLAKHYDLLYSWKDYKKEVDALRELIRTYKTSPGSDLLEVACGTGKHAELLQNDFSIVATDLNQDMLRIARRRCQRASFVHADMVSLELGRQF